MQFILRPGVYAATAWWGFTHADERDRLEKFISRMKRIGHRSGDARDVARMVEGSEDGLFRSIIDQEFHVLRPIFPPTVDRQYNLKPRPHDFVLPPRDDINYLPQSKAFVVLLSVAR